MSSTQLDLITVSKRPFNAETPKQAFHDPLTPNNQFYVRNHFDVPALEETSWRLHVNGAINTTQNLSMQDLQKLPTRTIPILMECAGNGRSSLDPQINGTTWDLGAVSQAEFTGTSLSNVLELADPKDSALEVLFTGADKGQIHTGEIAHYVRSLPIEMANNPDLLLAWEMNGEALKPNHGYPLRLVMPNWYGMASVKWMHEISFLTSPFDGFFQSDDYVYSGTQEFPEGDPVRNMRVRSLILSHDNGDNLKPGTHEITGIAWSGDGVITEVIVSFDGGRNWGKAELLPTTGKYTWTPWRVKMDFQQPGSFTLVSRATDSGGATQPLEQMWNRGGYGNNLIQMIDISVE